MNQKMRWVVLSVSLVFLYFITYVLYVYTATGKSILGLVPEFLLYLVPMYFISSVLIEFLVGDPQHQTIKIVLGKASILLIFYILFLGTYWAFYEYIIVVYQLEKTIIGEYAYLVFIMLMILLGNKCSQKLYAKDVGTQ